MATQPCDQWVRCRDHLACGVGDRLHKVSCGRLDRRGAHSCSRRDVSWDQASLPASRARAYHLSSSLAGGDPAPSRCADCFTESCSDIQPGLCPFDLTTYRMPSSACKKKRQRTVFSLGL